MTSKKIKASDRAAHAQVLIKLLKKRYKPVHKSAPTLLENVLYSICLENTQHAQAEHSFKFLMENFHDLNELRVSSMIEICEAFPKDSKASDRARRISDILHFTFEQYYAFELDSLKKKPPESLDKTLQKISSLSPFVRNSIILQVLGSHIVPLDNATLHACQFLGLVEAHSTIQEASEQMKSVFRKAETQEMMEYLRCFGTDPEFVKYIDPVKYQKLTDEEVFESSQDRLNSMLHGKFDFKMETKVPPVKKAAPAPAVVEKSKAADHSKTVAPAKKKAPAAAAPAPKSAAKAVSKSKPQAKKAPAKKPAAAPAKKKAPAKKAR
jgi:endonuclease-3